MFFDKLKYESCYSNYLVNYLTEKQSIGNNVFYLKYILRDFDRFVINNNFNNGEELPKCLVEKWLIRKENEKYSTRKTRASVIKNFAIYLSNYINNVFIVNTKQYYNGEKYIPFVLNKNQIKLLFEYLDNQIYDNFYDDSVKVILNLLYSCGFRINEVLQLKIEDINFDENIIIINNGKGKKQRVAPIHEYNKQLIIDFMGKYFVEYSIDEYIFKNQKTNKLLTKNTVLKHFHDICETLNIKSNYNKYPRIHDLRYTHIIHSILKLEEEGKNIDAYLPVISTLVGHEGISSTMYYLQFIPDRMKIINQISDDIIIPKMEENNE